MTDKTMFGKESLVLGNNFGSEITDAYISVRNAYVAANEADADESYVQTLRSIAYDDGGLGDAQNQSDSPKVSDFDVGSSSFPTVETENGVLPEGVPVEPDDPEAAIHRLQSLLSEWFAEPAEVVADGQGRSMLKKRREQQSNGSEPEETDETDTELEEKLTGLYGIGPSNVSEVAEQLNSDVELVGSILSELDSVESYEMAEVDRLAEVAGEERAEALRELFPDKSEEALVAFESG